MKVTDLTCPTCGTSVIQSKCESCNYKKACTGGCLAVNYDVFGNTHSSPEAFCTIKQLVTEVLADLCKSLQNNPTFQKVYKKSQPPQPNANEKPSNPPTNQANQGGAKP